METIAKKVWEKDQIKALLESNDKFVMRSVVKIWERQTDTEKIASTTNQNNGKGYNSTDAFIMTQFAEYFLQKGTLSEKQLTIARRKIMKYATQLTVIANS